MVNEIADKSCKDPVVTAVSVQIGYGHRPFAVPVIRQLCITLQVNPASHMCSVDADHTCEQRTSQRFALHNGTPSTEAPRFAPGAWMLLAYDTGRQPMGLHRGNAMPAMQVCQQLLLDSRVQQLRQEVEHWIHGQGTKVFPEKHCCPANLQLASRG